MNKQDSEVGKRECPMEETDDRNNIALITLEADDNLAETFLLSAETYVGEYNFPAGGYEKIISLYFCTYFIITLDSLSK